MRTRLTRKEVDHKQNIWHFREMMARLIQTEAIVLQAIAFKDYDRILTLFSPDGLFKLFAKGSKRNYYHFAALTEPLTHGEFHYRLGQKELHRLYEGSIIAQNLGLRKGYELLETAEKMAKALLLSQWVGKPAPRLFQLFHLFLEKLPLAENPPSLLAPFLLKILSHEGLLQVGPAKASYRYGGECYSIQEGPPGALFFSEEEEKCLTQLVGCRSFNQLTTYKFDLMFQQKVESLFQQTFR